VTNPLGIRSPAFVGFGDRSADRCRCRGMRMHSSLVRLSVAFVALIVATPASARDTKSWDHASSIGRDALVAIALGVPAIQQDWTGDLQAGASLGAAFLATEGLKHAFPETRPDHSDRKSFPSGHTSVSFAAAATLQNRYGWQAGVPAQLVAALVGLSRVEARKHHWYDVAVGAAIGETSGFLVTSKRNDAVRLTPWGDAHGGGAALALAF
jgi:membrane-associated phospholipid phosphatase